MKPLTNEQIRYLLTTPIDAKPLGCHVREVDGTEGTKSYVDPKAPDLCHLPDEFEASFPGGPICAQVTLPYHRHHMSRLSLFRFRWIDDKPDIDHETMPWDWEHTAWVPVHLFEAAIFAIVRQVFGDGLEKSLDIEGAVYAFGDHGEKGDKLPTWVRTDRYLGSGSVSLDGGSNVRFFWTYQGREVKFEVPMFLILNTARGCLAKHEATGGRS